MLVACLHQQRSRIARTVLARSFNFRAFGSTVLARKRMSASPTLSKRSQTLALLPDQLSISLSDDSSATPYKRRRMSVAAGAGDRKVHRAQIPSPLQTFLHADRYHLHKGGTGQCEIACADLTLCFQEVIDKILAAVRLLCNSLSAERSCAVQRCA